MRSLDEACSAVASRLRERLPEIQAAIATRVYAISDPHDVADPAYLQGLDAAVAAAIEHRLAVLERVSAAPRSFRRPCSHRLAWMRATAFPSTRSCVATSPATPSSGTSSSRRRSAPKSRARPFAACSARRRHSAIALPAAVSAEYAREAGNRPSSASERRRECVKSLLAGELVDHSDLGYDLDAHHLALMAKGEGAQEAMRVLAGRLDRRLLAVRREEEHAWACWLGGRHPLEAERALRALGEIPLDGVWVTLGEPGDGLVGRRLSHRQAKAALPIAARRGQAILRYADVALLASILRDDLVTTSLRQLYLEPLERARDDGKVGRETLRAYFAAERNVSSTAAALGVDRRRSRTAFVPSRGSSAAPSRTSRRSWRPRCCSTIDSVAGLPGLLIPG